MKISIFFLFFIFFQGYTRKEITLTLELYTSLLTNNYTTSSLGLVWANYSSVLNNTLNMVIVHSMTNVTSISLFINDTLTTNLLDPNKPLFCKREFFNLSSNYVDLLNKGKWKVVISSGNDPITDLFGTLTVSTQFIPQPNETAIVPITWRTWFSLGLVLLMLVVLAFDYFESWFVIFFTCLIFHFFGILSLKELEDSFSQEPMLTVIFLIICVEPLQRSTLLAFISRYVFGSGNGWFWARINLLRVCIILGICSGFLANAAMTVLFTPIVKEWCRRNDISASKFLMPMLYSIISGGDFTTIGSSTNILVTGLLVKGGFKNLGFFELSYIALPCFSILMIYNFFFAFWLLPDTGGMFRVVKEDGREFLIELIVIPKSKLIGKSVKQAKEILQMQEMSVVEIMRRNPNIKKDTPILDSPNKFLEKETPIEEKKLEELKDPIIQEILDSQNQPQNDVKKEVEKTTPIEENQSGVLSNEIPLKNISHDESKVTDDLIPQKEPEFIRIVPVQDDQILLDDDRIVLSGEVHNIIKLHKVGSIESYVKYNTKFDYHEMIGETVEPKKDETKIEIEKPTSTFRQKLGKYLKFKKKEDSEAPEFFEVVVSRENPCLGKTIKECNFSGRYDCAILAVRHTGELIKKNFDDFKLSVGDTILILSKKSFYQKFNSQQDFYMISRLNTLFNHNDDYVVHLFGRRFDFWWWNYLCFPLFILLIVIVSISNNLRWGFSMARTSLILVAVYIITGITTTEKTIKSVSIKIVVLVGFSISIGTAITNSGLSTAFGQFISLLNLPYYLTPALFLLMTMIVTQFVHNNATAALFFPLAVGVVNQLGYNIIPLAVAVNIGSSSCYATPIGYECNLMIQGSGGYKFIHYVIYGLPICFIFLITAGILIPLIWPVK